MIQMPVAPVPRCVVVVKPQVQSPTLTLGGWAVASVCLAARPATCSGDHTYALFTPTR
jgi:hypothetical protein